MSSTEPGKQSLDNGQIRRKQVAEPNTAPRDSEVNGLPATPLINDHGGSPTPEKHPQDTVQDAGDDVQPQKPTRPGEKTRPRPSRWKLFSSVADEWWVFELAAFVVALISAAALIIVLAHFDGKPQTSWEFGITLNSVVSFLVTIAETAAMGAVTAAVSQGMWLWFSQNGREGKLADIVALDSASRGFMGSLSLLWMTKGRRIISLGAFLTVIAILIDPLSQLLLTVEYREVNTSSQHNDIGIVPRAERFEEYAPGGIQDTKSIALPMLAAIDSGLYSPGIDYPHVTCPTSHCTWPTIPTLAFCGECTNLTSKLNTTCDDSGGLSCTWALPNGAFISGSNKTSLSTMVNSSSPPPLVYANSTYPYLSHFDVIGAEGSSIVLDNVTAFECAFWFCIKAYSISSVNGNQTNTLVGTWDEYASNPFKDNNDLHSDFNFTTPPPSNLTLLNIDPNATFSIHAFVIGAMLDAIGSLFIGTVDAGDGEADYSSTVMQAMYEAEDIPSWVENIALSVTNHIRFTPALIDPSDDPLNYTHGRVYNGTVYEVVAFVRVRWLWLIYPITILILGLVFLVVTMVLTQRSRVGAWKSSPLALLFCPLEDTLHGWFEDAAADKGGKVWTATEMETLADVVRVRVTKGDDGWKFRSAGGEN